MDYQELVYKIIGRLYEMSEEMISLTQYQGTVSFVDDIKIAIGKIDKSYVETHLKDITPLGLLYANNNGELNIYIKKQDISNTVLTIAHELVHLSDYLNFSKHMRTNEFRDLMDDSSFRWWSEFHATYLSYRYVLELPENMDINNISNTIHSEIVEFLSNNPKEHYDPTSKLVRLYGEKMAVDYQLNTSSNKNIQELIKDTFLCEIYTFLEEHRNCSSFIRDYYSFKALLNRGSVKR